MAAIVNKDSFNDDSFKHIKQINNISNSEIYFKEKLIKRELTKYQSTYSFLRKRERSTKVL